MAMALDSVGKFLLRVFGSRNERLVKSYMSMVDRINSFESEARALSDEELKGKREEFRSRLSKGEKPRDFLAEAFAVVREAARRTLQMRHFDVQLVGGLVLYEGKIAEMATGEGKTLVATLPVYMQHIVGKKVHIVTVNDYLAKRDAEWMRPVYELLGLSVGAIQADMDTRGTERKEQYGCDVCYGTNNEFGFDYLRDNMKVSIEDMVQGPLDYCIIDEVDSILIDEARTPLIISGPAVDDVSRYKKADSVARQLINLHSDYQRAKNKIDSTERAISNANGELSDAKKKKDSGRIEAAQKRISQLEEELSRANEQLGKSVQYYEIEPERKSVHMTHEGIGAAQEIAQIGSFFTGSNMDWPHLLEQSLRAHIIYEREKDYVVIDGKVVIVDEFTGRLMHGRQWSDGLHQAVEAKENVAVKEETQTLATITLQNFFKLYGQISGMTGTAYTESEEFMKIYKLEVVVIPTNKPCVRDDRNDFIFKTMKEKFDAIVDEIHEISASGRPVLVGTVSIEKSEAISGALTRKYGLEHEVLNAKQHQREASIVEKAGFQHTGRDGKTYGNVTIATNMAGRGTDIKLADGVAEMGGLHIVGTERHESRRIDNQLRGRAGRQGDAGSSVFFLSFEDDLMRIFAPEWTIKALSLIGWQEGEPIYHSRISKGIEKAQKKVEERNFEQRKSLLEYDEVMDYQRKIFYSRRRKILEGEGLKGIIEEMIDDVIEKSRETILAEDYPVRCICEWARSSFGVEIEPGQVKGLNVDEIEHQVKLEALGSAFNDIEITLGEYLEDYEDRRSWNIDGLCKWAMSRFSAGLTAGKLRHMDPEQIQETINEAVKEQINSRDCSQLTEFVKEDYSLRMFAQWASLKFDIKGFTAEKLEGKNADQIVDSLKSAVSDKYNQRQIEYPVEFAMNMAYGPRAAGLYGFEALAEWAKKKYDTEMDPNRLQEMKPGDVQRTLLDLSRLYFNGKLTEIIESKFSSETDSESIAKWASERFDADIEAEHEDGEDDGSFRDTVTQAAESFMRKELCDLEKYVLVQIYDTAWKDHLYAMDHLKEGIFLRAFAEKDPRIEYKQEGFRMFNEMLDQIEDKVTDTIFKVRLDAGTRTKSVWNVSSSSHDQVDQFAMAERQRAAATAPQKTDKPKQIVKQGPKVGRNDPCPCGSGRKYKKCCGKNT